MPLPFQNQRRATLTGADATADRVERRRCLGWKCITRIRMPFAGTMHERQEAVTYGAWRPAEEAVWLGPSTVNHFSDEHCGLMGRRWRECGQLRHGNMGRIAKCAARSKKHSCLRVIGRFRPADRSDSLEIHSNCEFTEMRRHSARRKGPLELGGNLREFVYNINSLTTLIRIRCRGICATSAYKKVRVASDEAVFCCLFRTLRLLSELRRRGASRGRPVKWFA
jgi:hypothetical protein